MSSSKVKSKTFLYLLTSWYCPFELHAVVESLSLSLSLSLTHTQTRVYGRFRCAVPSLCNTAMAFAGRKQPALLHDSEVGDCLLGSESEESCSGLECHSTSLSRHPDL
jgi:hypothetical protein